MQENITQNKLSKTKSESSEKSLIQNIEKNIANILLEDLLNWERKNDKGDIKKLQNILINILEEYKETSKLEITSEEIEKIYSMLKKNKLDEEIIELSKIWGKWEEIAENYGVNIVKKTFKEKIKDKLDFTKFISDIEDNHIKGNDFNRLERTVIYTSAVVPPIAGFFSPMPGGLPAGMLFSQKAAITMSKLLLKLHKNTYSEENLWWNELNWSIQTKFKSDISKFLKKHWNHIYDLLMPQIIKDIHACEVEKTITPAEFMEKIKNRFDLVVASQWDDFSIQLKMKWKFEEFINNFLHVHKCERYIKNQTKNRYVLLNLLVWYEKHVNKYAFETGYNNTTQNNFNKTCTEIHEMGGLKKLGVFIQDIIWANSFFDTKYILLGLKEIKTMNQELYDYESIDKKIEQWENIKYTELHWKIRNMIILYEFRKKIFERTNYKKTPNLFFLSWWWGFCATHFWLLANYEKNHWIVPDWLISSSGGTISAIIYSFLKNIWIETKDIINYYFWANNLSAVPLLKSHPNYDKAYNLRTWLKIYNSIFEEYHISKANIQNIIGEYLANIEYILYLYSEKIGNQLKIEDFTFNDLPIPNIFLSSLQKTTSVTNKVNENIITNVLFDLQSNLANKFVCLWNTDLVTSSTIASSNFYWWIWIVKKWWFNLLDWDFISSESHQDVLYNLSKSLWKVNVYILDSYLWRNKYNLTLDPQKIIQLNQIDKKYAKIFYNEWLDHNILI